MTIKPYPRHCAFCGEDQVQQKRIKYHGEVRVMGGIIFVCIPSLPVDKCGGCGEIYFTTNTDEAISNHLSRK